MKRSSLAPAALILLACCAAPALAQTPPSQNNPAGLHGANSTIAGPGTAVSTDVQEQVEIMRRLLDKALLEAYGLPRAPAPPALRFGGQGNGGPMSVDFGFPMKNPADPNATPPGAFHVLGAPHTEGVYLKDYGVVYTATLPAPPYSVTAPGGGPPGNKPAPDDWDRIRKEIHGEQPDPGAKGVPGHTPLSEVILKVLADNGRHFSGLQDGEKVTVAVTFRGAASCANCHQTPWGNGPIATFRYRLADSGLAPQPNAEPMTGTSPGASEVPQYIADARNDALLGDLHMKQGKVQDAIQAYQKAAQHLQSLHQHQESPPGLSSADVPALLMAVDLGNKLAAAYVQAGDAEAASKTLKATAEFANQAEKLTGTAVPGNPAPAATTGAALPSKLMVNATKQQMMDVGAGKLTFDAFCKAATIEYINPATDKK